MTKCKFTVIMVWLMVESITSGYSQQTDLRREQQMEQLVESLAATEEGTSESTLLLEDLSYYSGQPIFINIATEEELLRLNLFNFKQVREIISYREKYGRIVTLNELSVMEDFTEELLQKVEPFVHFDTPRDSLQKKWDRVIRQTLLFRIKETFPVSSGYLPRNDKQPVYGGIPLSSFARYRAEVGKWMEFGITAENDAGEDFFSNSNRQGYDFLSGFISFQGKGVIKKMVAGDYHLRFGQGVNLWSGGGVSYVSDLSSLMRSGEGIRPYSSSDENLFFRGAAVQLGMNPVKLSLFFSDKRRDANLETDPAGVDYITSFRMDGLHRTISEMADEKDVHESMIGGYFDFRFSKWRFGLLSSFQKFGLAVSKGNLPYKSKSFEGAVNCNLGFDYHLIMNQISFFGEAGLSRNLKPAFVNGMVWKAHPQMSVSFLYRYYDPAFQSFYSGSFSGGSGGKNEEGFYAAFEYFPIAKLKISGQADLYYFPWMTYSTISPAHGHTLALQTEYSIGADLMVYLHARLTLKPQKTSGITGVPEQWDESTAKWRLHCDWKMNDKIQLRSRLEYVRYNYQSINENGCLFYQDLIYTVSMKLKCWYRITLYCTEGYNSRVYSYENDLLYYFSIPEFHGKGIRSYINLKYQPLRLMAFYLKAGYTVRDGATTMGSGNDETQGGYRFDLRGQICLKF